MLVLRPQAKKNKSISNSYYSIAVILFLMCSAWLSMVPTATTEQGNFDNFGYNWIDSNTPSPTIGYNWTDGITGGTALNLNNDQNSGYISIGFKFPFYGGSYSNMIEATQVIERKSHLT